MRSRLARRLVLPLLLLIGVLFGLLAITGVAQAERRVEAELSSEADRIAATMDEMSVSASQRGAILLAMSRLLDVELVLGATATGPSLDHADTAKYRRIERSVRGSTETLTILVPNARIAARRSGFLGPVLSTAALGFAFVLLFGLALSKMIVRPVKRLADRVRAFGEGEPAGEIRPRAVGELGDLEEAFVRMAGTVRETERLAALGRFAGGIAHELRNPLTAIRMAVETGGDDARGIALSEIDRLDRTLTELLDFVRPRPLDRTPIPVESLLDEVAKLLGPQCEHLRVRLDVLPEPSAVIHADRDRVRQSLLNLVLNAAQAQPSGGVVRVTAGNEWVSVSDEGGGVPDDVRDSIFEPFVTTRTAGIGLGLAVVKRIADEHGAQIKLDSSPAGTTFKIDFGDAPRQ
jgi:signal transduction histidine kinase